MDTTLSPHTRNGATTYADHTDPVERQQQHGSTAEAMAHIHGWGADLDRADRPAVPMERTPPRLDNVHWDVPSYQEPRHKIHHSIERPGITPVFGTSVPPSGLSGKLRDVAFTFSENDLRHWMILLLADRINVGEGIVHDLAHGHVPNILAEMGAAAEWKYNRAGFIKKAVITSAAVGLAVYWLRRRRSDD